MGLSASGGFACPAVASFHSLYPPWSPTDGYALRAIAAVKEQPESERVCCGVGRRLATR